MKFFPLSGLLLVTWVFLADQSMADPVKPFISPLFSDNMVLQRDQKDPVWGWTNPRENVTVKIQDQSASGVAGPDGLWRVDIQAPPTGGPYEMVVSGPSEVHFKNVMVGDVWLCSGQSNMTFGIQMVNNSKDEVAAADHPNLRLFTVPEELRLDPGDQLKEGMWLVSSPETVQKGRWGGFSGTAYFFGRELQAAIKIPVGLIHSSWGGTPIQGWTSETALQAATPDFDGLIEKVREVRDKLKTNSYSYDQEKDEWFKAAGGSVEMANPDFDDSGWKTVNLPAATEAGSPNKMPEGDGIFNLRKVIDLPADVVGKSGRITFGFVKYRDEVRINNQTVGSNTGNGDRNYQFGGNILKAGKNVITMRTFDQGGPAGVYGKPEDLKLEIFGGQPVPLAGEWRYEIGPSVRGSTLPPFPPKIVYNTDVPSELYNGMINPLIPFGIKGVIWYQGENNGGAAFQYRTLLPTMIADWRARWGEGDFPFLIVQLANFDAPPKDPGDSDWAELREAQWLTTLKVPNTGLATAVDIGDHKDIHPKNKQEVGRRLSLVARAMVYQEKIECSGPVYQSMQVEGDHIRIKFTHAEGLKTADSTVPNTGNPGDAPPPPTPLPVGSLSIAGEDHKWYWADGKIDGQDLLVSSPQVPNPQMVRYDWAKGPTGNLYNQAGLPALPFRTDDLPMVTLKNKY